MAVRPDWDKYANEICRELEYWGTILGPADIPTIFFGGGTPSLMPTSTFSQIMNKINHCFRIAKDCEVTLESNPGTLDAARMTEFIESGVNRLSVGVQSLNDTELEFMGRRHTVHDALGLLDAAGKRGIRVSADFIYGLPGHTADTVIGMCRDINRLGLQHCSMYELTIEPDTPFGKMGLEMPSNNEMADMYTAIGDTLNLTRYEISNYAAPGFECRHNLNIWDGAPYIGIGRGAAGRIYTTDGWFEQMGAGARFSPLSPEARATEKIITGMRTVRGVKITPDTEKIINWDWVSQNPDLIKEQDKRLCATPDGVLTLEHMLVELIK